MMIPAELLAITGEMIDVLELIGFTIGMLGAIYLRTIYYKNPQVWLPFVLVAVAFGFLGAEGGFLDVLGPGTLRVLALCILVGAELAGMFAATRQPAEQL